MISGRKCPLLTLVLFLFISSFAVKVYGAPDVTVTEIKESSGSENEPPEGVQQMDISETPKVDPAAVKNTHQSIYFPYQSSLSPRLGFGTDTNRVKSNKYYYFYGLHYQLPSDNGKHWEAGADVIDDGTGILIVGRKLRLNPTEAIRPYFKIAGAIHVNPSEELTTFLRSENFQLRPSTGFEYFLQHPSSIRLDLESWISLRHIGFHLSMGYSYAF